MRSKCVAEIVEKSAEIRKLGVKRSTGFCPEPEEHTLRGLMD